MISTRLKQLSNSTAGGVLVAALLTVGILASISALTLMGVNSRHRGSYHAAGWRDALAAAESGVERALAELQTSIEDPANAWAGWVVVDADGKPAATQTINHSGRWAPGYTLRMNSTLPAQDGENRDTQFSVTVDVPTTLAATPRRWNQSYRIRATGVAPLPNATRSVTDKRDSQLRRLSLDKDRTVGFQTSGSRLAAPQATRTIEVIAKPESVYRYGLISEIHFKLHKKTFIDGYNSNYPDTSTNGKYDPSKRTPDGGTVMANRWKKKSRPGKEEEKFDVGNASIWGDLVVKGSLKNVKNYGNVKGNKITNVSVETPTNLAPVWTSVTANIPTLDGKIPDALKETFKIAEKQAKAGGPAAVFEAKSAAAAAELAAKGMELSGGADPANPARYKVGKIEVNKKDESLVLNNPPGATESWVEIWVTDELKIEKGGTMFVSDGVHVKIFLEGKKAEIKDTKQEKGGFILESGFAGDLQLIGIEHSDAKKESDDDFSPRKRSGKISISDADFTGVINAPDWDVDFKPKDWDKEDTIYGAQLFGSVLGRKVKVGNGADYHYDAAVSEIGSVLNYSIVGWNELER
jgi:hypothetical protein